MFKFEIDCSVWISWESDYYGFIQTTTKVFLKINQMRSVYL